MTARPQRIRPTRRHYDVVVVGARAAGASTAMLLANRGLRVLAIDKQRYGSDTLSTHALMRGAIDSLDRWGVLGTVFATGTPVIEQTAFQYGDEEVVLDVKATPTVPGLAAPRRTVLDPILVDAAQAAGAEIMHQTSLLGLTTEHFGDPGRGDRVTGVEIECPDGAVLSISADLVIGADGLRSKIARSVQAPVTHQGRHASAYAARYLDNLDVPMNSFRWLYRPGIGGGVIPTTDGTVCVFAAMTPERFKREARVDTEATFSAIISELDEDLGRAVAAATPNGPIRSWPGVAGRFVKPFGPGWALVGDAGYFKDPFAAHGISDALRDAELLAEAVATGDFAGYESMRDELSRPLFDQLEQIASYEWDLETLPVIHYGLSKAMQSESKQLAAHRQAVNSLVPAAA